MISFLCKNKNAFKRIEGLYNKYGRLLYNVAYEILGEKHLAEKSVYKTFIRVVKDHGKTHWVDGHKEKNFITIICKTICYNMLKYKSISSKEVRYILGREVSM